MYHFPKVRPSSFFFCISSHSWDACCAILVLSSYTDECVPVRERRACVCAVFCALPDVLMSANRNKNMYPNNVTCVNCKLEANLRIIIIIFAIVTSHWYHRTAADGSDLHDCSVCALTMYGTGPFFSDVTEIQLVV